MHTPIGMYIMQSYTMHVHMYVATSHVLVAQPCNYIHVHTYVA